MKRIIPAMIILVFIISLCVFSHVYIDRSCDQTINDINNFKKNVISADTLHHLWQKRKEKMSIFVNHGFLDEISLYIGQLTAYNDKDSEHFDHTVKNINTILSMINAEQQLAAHSFY